MRRNSMERLFSEKQIESSLGLSARWLQKLRYTGGGPTYLKLGRAVRYRLSDVEDYLEERKRSSTSQQMTKTTL
jgi:predicted DNA-binding transcriptional regulator AlpA